LGFATPLPSIVSNLSTLDVAGRFKDVALHEGKQEPVAVMAPVTRSGSRPQREDGASPSPTQSVQLHDPAGLLERGLWATREQHYCAAWIRI
jgi:hypothetical protein